MIRQEAQARLTFLLTSAAVQLSEVTLGFRQTRVQISALSLAPQRTVGSCRPSHSSGPSAGTERWSREAERDQDEPHPVAGEPAHDPRGRGAEAKHMESVLCAPNSVHIPPTLAPQLQGPRGCSAPPASPLPPPLPPFQVPLCSECSEVSRKSFFPHQTGRIVTS